ncbi:glycosyl transferase [Mycobacterium sp. EPG1]|nr:glycosyl transferase [Mycobacterium sp. EPG1]
MSDSKPTICLNMIVRNEAHIVHELLDSVAPFIDSWVIVDTGSTDGTQDKIRSHMAGLGIPGELHERPWRDFGHNRSEALALARGRADYIWVMDADDVLVGMPDFTGLTADVYQLLYGPDVAYWRRQLFRGDMPWRYVGVLHEYADCDVPFEELRLEGDYYIESRRLGGRNLDPEKYARDAAILLTEVERDPENPRSVFYLAQSYFDYGDMVNARKWYERRAAMAGYDEEIYYALARVGECMANLGEPWPDVQDAYLRAWEFRPTRAETLYSIAYWYRSRERYRLGYLFAEQAAGIPLPESDALFVSADIYLWKAKDELAVCASWIGKQDESFALCREILARDDVPEDARQRIAGNRDICVPTVIEHTGAYPVDKAQDSIVRPGGDVTLTMVAGPDRAATEGTLNSLLNCFSDTTRVARILIADIGLWPEDRATLLDLYPGVEIRSFAPGLQPRQLRGEVSTRFWLSLGMGWRFVAIEDYIGRLTAVLDAECQICQVGVNVGDKDKADGTVATLSSVRRGPGTGHYVRTDVASAGPSMFDCSRWDGSQTSLRTATLDEVLCIL